MTSTANYNDRKVLHGVLEIGKELEYVQLLLLRQVQRFKQSAAFSPEFLSAGMTITDYQVDQALYELILDEEASSRYETTNLDGKILEVKDHLASSRLDASPNHSISRLGKFVSIFDLTEVEELVLTLTLAVELDKRYGTLIAYLHDNAMKRQPSLELIFSLLLIDNIQWWGENSSDQIINALQL